MITEAYIAGAINRAVFKKDGEYFISEKSVNDEYHSFPANHFDLSNFTFANPEITHFTDINWEINLLNKEIDKHAEKHEALNFFLMGMDSSLSDELRKEAMELALETLFTNSEIETFVCNRIFATKVPSGFNPLSASKIAESLNNKKLVKWYNELSYANEIIIAVRDAWKKTILNQRNLSDLNTDILDKEFTDRGIFSDFVLALINHNYKRIDDAIIMHAEELNALKIGQPGIFLTTLRQLIYDILSLTSDSGERNALEEIRNIDEKYERETQDDFINKFNLLIDNFRGKTKRKKQRKRGEKIKTILLSKFYKQTNVNDQVAWIKDRINTSDIKSAEGAILNLIEYQDLNSDAEHLCKSLCDIAEGFQKIFQFATSDLIASRAADLNPKDAVPHCIIAETFRSKGQLDFAIKTYDFTIISFPDNVVPRRGKAETLRQMGRLQDALDLYDQTIKIFPGEIVSLCGKAETLRQMGRLDEALSAYEKTIRLFKNDVIPRTGKAEALRQMGRLDEALTTYEEIIYDFKSDVFPRTGKAETLRQMGRLDEALTTYEQTIKDFKNNVVAQNGKAETLRQLGRLDEALSAYEQIIRDFKSDVVPRNGKAGTLRQMGRLDEALITYEQIIKDFPYDQFAKKARFVLLIQIGENFSQLEKETQIDMPKTIDDWVLNHIHCMLLIKQNKLDKAISKLKKGVDEIEDVENRNYYRNALSYAYIKNRKYKEAVTHLKSEINPQPFFKVLVTHAYAGEGNILESKKHFNSIFQSKIKKINEVSKRLSDRYNLTSQYFFAGKSKQDLEVEIENLEFDLLTESYLIAA